MNNYDICTYCGETKNIRKVNGLISCSICNSVLASFVNSNDIDGSGTGSDSYDRSKPNKYMTVDTFSATFNTLWHNIEILLNKMLPLKGITVDERKHILVNATSILHHSQILWSGWDSTTDENSIHIQLPKDCLMRLLAVIYYVVNYIDSVMKKINMNDLLYECYMFGRRARRGKQLFITSVFNFISMIQEFKLGGAEYLNIKKRILGNNYQCFEEFDHLIDSVSVVEYYEKKLNCYFDHFENHKKYKEESLNLYREVMKDVVLEGKGPRIAMMIVVIYVCELKDVILKEKITHQNTAENKRRRLKHNFSVTVDKILDTFLTEKENYFMLVYSYFLFSNLLDDKSYNRKRINFIKNMQILIKHIHKSDVN